MNLNFDTAREIASLNKDLNDSPYRLQSFLGLGSFGKVFQGLECRTLRPCAIKVFVKSDFKLNMQEIIYDEANLLKTLSHPNIVQFYGLIETPSRIYLIMELLSGGSLKTLLQDRKKANLPFTEQELRTLLSGLIAAIRYLHSNEIVHRDVKPENILFQDPENLASIKLIDFGLSVQFQDASKNLYLNCGTPLFMAPELKKYKIYSKPVDIWSCGIVLYELCTMGEHPFYRKGGSCDEFAVNYPPNMPSLVENLLKKMLAVEPSERYNAENIAQHPFLTGKSVENIPMSSIEMVKAFRNQENFLNVIKMVMICKQLQRLCPRLTEPRHFAQRSVEIQQSSTWKPESPNKKGKIKLQPILINETPRMPKESLSKTSSISSKKGLSPSIFQSEEPSIKKPIEKKREQARKKVHLFSFNLCEEDLKRVVSDFRENERQVVLTESIHIDSIMGKGKLKSPILRPVGGFKNSTSTQSDMTDESNSPRNEEFRLPVIKTRIKSCYSSSPKKK